MGFTDDRKYLWAGGLDDSRIYVFDVGTHPGADNEQMLRAFHWDGHTLSDAFQIDFTREKLGRPHHMKFTARPAQQVALLTRER